MKPNEIYMTYAHVNAARALAEAARAVTENFRRKHSLVLETRISRLTKALAAYEEAAKAVPAKEANDWVKEMLRAVLEEGLDLDTVEPEEVDELVERCVPIYQQHAPQELAREDLDELIARAGPPLPEDMAALERLGNPFLNPKEPAKPEGKQVCYFINDHDFGEGSLLHDNRAAHQWFKAFLENLDDGDEIDVTFKRKDMTEEEIEKLPTI
jgi:hypothetical protein